MGRGGGREGEAGGRQAEEVRERRKPEERAQVAGSRGGRCELVLLSSGSRGWELLAQWLQRGGWSGPSLVPSGARGGREGHSPEQGDRKGSRVQARGPGPRSGGDGGPEPRKLIPAATPLGCNQARLVPTGARPRPPVLSLPGLGPLPPSASPYLHSRVPCIRGATTTPTCGSHEQNLKFLVAPENKPKRNW